MFSAGICTMVTWILLCSFRGSHLSDSWKPWMVCFAPLPRVPRGQDESPSSTGSGGRGAPARLVGAEPAWRRPGHDDGAVTRRSCAGRVTPDAAHHWLITNMPEGLDVPMPTSRSVASSMLTVP